MTFRRVHWSGTDIKGCHIVWYANTYRQVAQDHPEAATDFNAIEDAVKDPDRITRDIDNQSRRCYYRLFSGPNQSENKVMKVIVEMNLFGPDRIITAYFANSYKPGEQTIWQKKKNN